MRRLGRIGLLAAFLVAGPALAASASLDPSSSIFEFAVDEATRGILVRDDRAPVIQLWLEFPVGTWSAWGREADLTSAMAIQSYDPAGELRLRSDALGVNINTWSSTRLSVVSVTCLRQDAAGAFELVRDMLLNDRFDRAEVKRWKRQADLEWRGRETSVPFHSRQLVARELFQAQDPRREPYERPRRVETDPKVLRQIRDRVVRLPGRTVGLAGDLTVAEAEQLVRGLLPPVDRAAATDTQPALLALRPRSDREDREAQVRRLTQVYFGLARESVAYDDPDYPAFVLTQHVLGGHFYSRIMVALRHEGGETYGAFARAEGDVAPGPFVVGSFTRADNAARAEDKLREALRAFHALGLTEQERSDAAGYLTGHAPFPRQTPAQVLGRVLGERRLGLPRGFFDDVASRAARLSLDEINAFVRNYYDPKAFVMGRVIPESR